MYKKVNGKGEMADLKKCIFLIIKNNFLERKSIFLCVILEAVFSRFNTLIQEKTASSITHKNIEFLSKKLLFIIKNSEISL